MDTLADRMWLVARMDSGFCSATTSDVALQTIIDSIDTPVMRVIVQRLVP